MKKFYVDRVTAHRDADEIIKGTYWENGRGCGVGCTVHSSDHDAYVKELGITWRLALLEDSIFENLPNDQAKNFPIQFLSAVPIGIDTDLVFKRFIIWNLSDEKEGLLNVLKDEKAIDVIKRVVTLYKESYTREINNDEWMAIANETRASASASASAYAYSEREEIRNQKSAGIINAGQVNSIFTGGKIIKLI